MAVYPGVIPVFYIPPGSPRFLSSSALFSFSDAFYSISVHVYAQGLHYFFSKVSADAEAINAKFKITAC